MEDKRKWCVAFEDAAKRLLKYSEDSEDLKVGFSELKEQLETPEEAGFSIMHTAKQARNDRGQKLFDIFRQGENKVYIASLARWDTQLKGLVELDSERQDVLVGVVVSKRDMQKEAPKKYQEKVFEEFKELGSKGQEKLWNSCKRRVCSKKGKRKENSENVAKIGRIEGDKALE